MGQLGAADSAMPIRRGQLGAGTIRRERFGAGHFDAMGALIMKLTQKEKD